MDIFTRAPAVRDGSYKIPGQAFMHELTHAWQVHHRGSIPTLICEGIYNQVGNSLGASVYDPTTSVKQWRDYNLEQQGAIVDIWYVDGMRPTHPFYRYIKANVLPASNDANSTPVFERTKSTTTLKLPFGGRVP